MHPWNSYLDAGLRVIRYTYIHVYVCVYVYIYTGRTGGVYRSDRAFMKASWDKTPKGVPTPEGDDVLALKLLIVSWEYERDGRWKATRLQRWFVEVHWFKAFLYYRPASFSRIYLHTLSIWGFAVSLLLDALWISVWFEIRLFQGWNGGCAANLNL